MKYKKNINNNLNIIIIVLIVLIILSTIFLLLRKKRLSFIIKNTNIEIAIGESKKIQYEADDSLSIAWESNNNKVSVDENGNITGKQYGTSIITGTTIINNETITRTCMVSVYSGKSDVLLKEINIPDGDIIMMPNSKMSIPISFFPTDAYVKSVDYQISNSNIVEVVDNEIISKSEGTASITIVVNGQISKNINVIVTNNASKNKIVKSLVSIEFEEESISLKVGESKKISYITNPLDAYIEKIKWTSSNDDVVSVKDGVLTAKKSGTSTIKVLANDSIQATVLINVITDAKELVVDRYPKKVLKEGETTKIIAHVLPSDSSVSLKYESSNPSVLSIDNGIIKGLKNGNAKITVSAGNNIEYSVDIDVLPSKGLINGTGNLWGYESLNAKVPVIASVDFFQKLASSGKGVLQGDKYIYGKYTYNIGSNLLQADGRNVLVRIYYPPNEDLSELSIFAYMGGDGENNFNGLFADAKSNPSVIKSGGISVLIAERNGSFTQYDGITAYQFVQSIIGQKSGIKNSIAGFSTGGTKVFWVADECNIDRVIVFSSYFNWPGYTKNLINKEIMVYIPNGDHLFSQASDFLQDLKNANYTNVTLVTNSDYLANKYRNDFLVINPGRLMVGAHVTENVTKAKLFEYVND